MEVAHCLHVVSSLRMGVSSVAVRCYSVMLQCGAVCCTRDTKDPHWCNVLQCVQCVAMCCNVLLLVVSSLRVWVLQCGVAVWCSVLCGVAVCCVVSQCGAVCCVVLQCGAVCCVVSQCGAVCCEVLQCGAVRCTARKTHETRTLLVCINALHHAATHCTTLQHTTPHCNTLHLTATHCVCGSLLFYVGCTSFVCLLRVYRPLLRVRMSPCVCTQVSVMCVITSHCVCRSLLCMDPFCVCGSLVCGSLVCIDPFCA